MAGKQRNLYDLLSDLGHHILVFEGRQETGKLKQLEARVVTLVKDCKVPILVHAIGKENQMVYERYGIAQSMLYLIRPDGHIGYRGSAENIDGLQDYLKRLFDS